MPKACYTATIVLVNGHKIMLDGFFDSLEEAQELWELTRKELDENGYIKVASGYIYYFNSNSINYVRIGLTTMDDTPDDKALKMIEDAGI